MDAAKRKALFRAKLNAQKKDKRIDSPLVRYNEFDQPICRVCDVVLKSESQWDGHQASRKHHEAINNLKGNAAGGNRINKVNAEPQKEPNKPKHVQNTELHDTKVEPLTKLPKPQSSGLPPDFFDNHEKKRQKTDTDTAKSLDTYSYKKQPGSIVQTKAAEPFLEPKKDGSNNIQAKNTDNARDKEIAASGTKQVKGALPEGFFDNKDADLRARGIKPVKPDVKDEYKEFEKLIQEDLQEVDDRLEEEEIDAAEMIEEAETLEQKTYRERVELLRTKKMELAAAKSTKCTKDSEVASKQSSHQESSSDEDSDEDFAVDWRAQHL